MIRRAVAAAKVISPPSTTSRLHLAATADRARGQERRLMWPTIAAAAIGFIAKWLGGVSGDKDQRELRRTEQQNAIVKGDMPTMRAVNEAAHKAE